MLLFAEGNAIDLWENNNKKENAQTSFSCSFIDFNMCYVGIQSTKFLIDVR